MHEFGIVAELVDKVVAQLKRDGVGRVARVTFRRGCAFMEEPLRQAFEVQARGTPLEGAEVVVLAMEIAHKCPCGREGLVSEDDLVGHMFLCPECGAAHELEGAIELELVEVTPA